MFVWFLYRDEAEALAKKLRLRFYRTSVKDNLNVEEVFRYLAEKYIQQLSAEDEEEQTSFHTIGSSNLTIFFIQFMFIYFDPLITF